MTARRQSTPPDSPGLWKRIRGDRERVLHVEYDADSDFLIVNGYIAATMFHESGDIWEGPHAIPTLEREERITAQKTALVEAAVALEVIRADAKGLGSGNFCPELEQQIESAAAAIRAALFVGTEQAKGKPTNE